MKRSGQATFEGIAPEKHEIQRLSMINVDHEAKIIGLLIMNLHAILACLTRILKWQEDLSHDEQRYDKDNYLVVLLVMALVH